MEVFVNAKKINEKMYNDDTIIVDILHNGHIVLQVEDNVRKFNNVNNNSIIKCSLETIMGDGSTFIKNMFFINGLKGKLNVKIDCKRK